MWISLVFAVGFLMAAVINTFGPERNLAEALGCYALAFASFAIWRWLRSGERQANAFLEWLNANRDSIKERSADYKGMTIDSQTEFTQFDMAISLVVFSVKAPSRCYIVGREPTLYPALGYSAASLVFGWWGIPWGPFFTLTAVASNLRGGNRHRVVDLIDAHLDHRRDVVQLTERAAENALRIMSERGFPADTAVQVEVAGRPGSPVYSITYDDHPPTDGSVWKSEAWGVPVIVQRRDEKRLSGLVVDFANGDYTFAIPPQEV